MEGLDPQAVTIGVVGAGVLAAVLWLFRSWTKQVSANFAAQSSLDERLPKIVDAITDPFKQIIGLQVDMLTETRAIAARAMDERERLTQQYVTHFGEVQKAHDDKVDKISRDAHDAHQRLHKRLDDCDAERKGQDSVIASLRADNSTLAGRLDRLEDRERQTLREAPSPHQQQPTTVSPLLPTVMVVPAGQTVIGPNQAQP